MSEQELCPYCEQQAEPSLYFPYCNRDHWIREKKTVLTSDLASNVGRSYKARPIT